MTESDFSRDGYAVLRNVIPANLLSVLSSYMSFRFAEDEYDPTLPPQKNGHRDPMGSTLYLELQSTIEECTGLSLIPTFSILREYGPNSELIRHTDKRSCEIVASICVNYEPDEVWPIYLQKGPDTDTVEVRLNPGDLVVYWGQEFEHWRNPYSGQTTQQIMLCFVDANGPYTVMQYGGIDSIKRVMEQLRNKG